MSSPEIIIKLLRADMKAARITYADLGKKLRLSESSVKRIFGTKDMSLTRLAKICNVLHVPMDDLLRRAADAAPQSDHLSLVQERSMVADAKLLLVAICCLGGWQYEQIIDTYQLTPAQCTAALVKLDRLDVIELKAGNQYRLKISRNFRWQADGPVQQYFRSHVIQDYFNGRFNQQDETLMLAHARLSRASAKQIVERSQVLVAQLGELHHQDRKLDPNILDGYTMILGVRSWEAQGFTQMRRKR